MPRFTNFVKRRLIGWVRAREGLGPLSDRAIATKFDLEVDQVPDLLAQMADEKLISFTGGARERAIVLLPGAGPEQMARVLPEPPPLPKRPTLPSLPKIETPAKAEAPVPAVPERSPSLAEAAAPTPQAEPLPQAAAPEAEPSSVRGRRPHLAAAIDRANDPARPASSLFERGKKPHIAADIIRDARAEGRELFEFCSALLRIGYIEWKLAQEARRS